MRDLGQVLAHIHDAEIEISEGAGPPERGGPVYAKELAGPALAGLWHCLACTRLSCGPHHFLLLFRL